MNHLKHRSISILILLVILLAASACSSNKEQSEPTTQPPAKQEEVNQETITPSNEQQANNDENPPTTRIISTTNGDLELPVNPTRIVALYMIGDLLAFGITPVGISDVYEGAAFEEEVAAVIKLGSWFEPNQEAIIDLAPDLILAPSQEVYEVLNKIAPTVFVDVFDQSPAETITQLGEILGRQEQAAQLIIDFDQQVAESRQQLADAGLLDKTVTILEGGSKGVIYATSSKNYGRGSQAVYEYLGLQAPPLVQQEIDENEQRLEQSGAISLSFEVLGDHIGDFVFRSSYEGMADLSDNVLWTSIPAVAEGRLINIPFGFAYYSDFFSLSKHLDYIVKEMLAASDSSATP